MAKKKTLAVNLLVFVRERGAEILPLTNQWELLRFNSAAGVGVIYTNAQGKITPTGAAPGAIAAMQNGTSWEGKPKPKKRKKANQQQINAIIERDGDPCFYCNKPLLEKDRTIEHLLSILHGGSHHLANLALAHEECNAKAGHLSVAEKVRLREVGKRDIWS